jgi:hypothetical protein
MMGKRKEIRIDVRLGWRIYLRLLLFGGVDDPRLP